MGSKAADSNIPFLSQIEGDYKMNMESAKALEADARYNADQRRKAGDRLLGEQLAATGMSGVELDGTPLDVMREDLIQAETEALNIIHSGKMQSTQMKRKAIMGRNSAYLSLVKDGASMAISAGAFKLGSSGGNLKPGDGIKDNFGGDTQASLDYMNS